MEDVGQSFFIRGNEERDIQKPTEGHAMAGANGKQKEKKWNNAKLFLKKTKRQRNKRFV